MRRNLTCTLVVVLALFAGCGGSDDTSVADEANVTHVSPPSLQQQRRQQQAAQLPKCESDGALAVAPPGVDPTKNLDCRPVPIEPPTHP